MASKKLRVGFDFDGVIAYNPIRVFRRPAMWLLELLSLKEKGSLHYPVPKGGHNKWLWAVIHETSFFPSYGLYDLAEMLNNKQIEGYLITGRYSFLKKALMRWLKYRGIDTVFEGLYLNDNDEQPHIYKERMIEKLGLDMYIEDNYDIVTHLANSKKLKSNTKNGPEIHWVYNLLDKHIDYPYKHPHMKSFVAYLKKRT